MLTFARPAAAGPARALAGLLLLGLAPAALWAADAPAPAAQAPSAQAQDIQDQFGAALEAIEQDRLRTARESLTAILGQNPSLSRARLELARVYYLSQDYAEARSQARQVLDDPNTPPQVRATVLAFLAQIDADEKKDLDTYAWTPSLYAGLMYDSNVNVGPSRNLIDIGGVPFEVDPNSQPQSDEAVVLIPALAHTWNPNERFEWGEHPGYFLWQSLASGYYRGYFSENDYNLGVVTLRTGPAWIVPRHWRASIAVQEDQIFLGGQSLALYSTLNPGITWEFGRDTEVTLDGLLTQRHYWQSEDDNRDGLLDFGRLGVAHYLDDGRIALLASAGYGHFNADVDPFSYTGPEFAGGIIVGAWQGGSVYARLTWRRYDYDGIEPGFNVSREDKETDVEAGFQHNFREGLMEGWLLQGNWIYTNNHSNVAIYEYDRNQVSLGLARSF